MMENLARTISPASIVVARKDGLSIELDKEAVILDSKGGFFYRLNTFGTLVWHLIQQPRSIEKLRYLLLKECKIEPDYCDRELLTLLQDLAAAGLVNATTSRPRAGLSPELSSGWNRNFSGINLRNANLSKTNLSRANFSKADLRGANLTNANLKGSNLCLAQLDTAELTRADLRIANLVSAELRQANCQNASLSGSNLSGSQLNGANLKYASLRQALLRGADLRGTNLRGADLFSSDLSDADLSDADLREVNLDRTCLKGAVYSPQTLFSDDFQPDRAGMSCRANAPQEQTASATKLHKPSRQEGLPLPPHLISTALEQPQTMAEAPTYPLPANRVIPQSSSPSMTKTNNRLLSRTASTITVGRLVGAIATIGLAAAATYLFYPNFKYGLASLPQSSAATFGRLKPFALQTRDSLVFCLSQLSTFSSCSTPSAERNQPPNLVTLLPHERTTVESEAAEQKPRPPHLPDRIHDSIPAADPLKPAPQQPLFRTVRSQAALPKPTEQRLSASIPLANGTKATTNNSTPGSVGTVIWPEGLAIRAEPSLLSGTIGGVPVRATVRVLRESSDGRWQLIRWERTGEEGWVKAGNISLQDEKAPFHSAALPNPQRLQPSVDLPTQPPQILAVGTRGRVVWPEGLAIRTAANLQAAYLDGIPANETAIATGVSPDGRWQRVRREANGSEGWVKAGNMVPILPQ